MHNMFLSLSMLFFVVSTGFVTAGEPVKIVTLGDSITRGVRPGVTAEQTFSALLQASLGKKRTDASVVNVGIGGERTDQALKRLKKDVISKRPALVVIMYGTNDSYVDIGAKQSRISSKAYGDNLRKLIAELRKANIVPILMTEPRWGDKAKPNGLGEHPNLRLKKYMVVCRKVAKDLKVPLVDNYQIWSSHHSKGIDIGGWTTDQCHPNSQGHRMIADSMLSVASKSLAGAGQPAK